MKLKMLEYVQGRDIHGTLEDGTVVDVLTPGTVYEIDEQLAAYLLEHRKAEKIGRKTPPVVEEKHYGAQAEPELRHDDEIADEAPKTRRGRK